MVIFEVYAYLFEFKEGDPPQADQPPQYDLPDLRGRQEYIEYFEDSADASLRVTKVPKFEPDAGTSVKL